MFDTEEERGLDRSRRGEDLQELIREEGVDAYAGRLSPEHIEEFQAVTAVMREIMAEKPSNQLLNNSTKLTPTQRFALETLYKAKTAKDTETGEFISGIERGDLFNQALMHLQPIVALGLRPDFTEGRPVYDQLVGQVTQVRAEITTAINVQIIPPKKREDVAKTEQDDTDEPDDHEGEPGDEPTAASGEAEATDRADLSSDPTAENQTRGGDEPAQE